MTAGTTEDHLSDRAQQLLKVLVTEGDSIPSGTAHVRFDPTHTHLYSNGWLVK